MAWLCFPLLCLCLPMCKNPERQHHWPTLPNRRQRCSQHHHSPWCSVGLESSRVIHCLLPQGGNLLANLKAKLSGECGDVRLAQNWRETRSLEGRREGQRPMGPTDSQRLGAMKAVGEEDGPLSRGGTGRGWGGAWRKARGRSRHLSLSNGRPQRHKWC